MPELFFNRELSWLKFNERVLEEACDTATPLFERLRFVSIFASNLDEFYMVRVGSLLDQSLIGKKNTDTKTGMTPGEQIAAVNAAARELYPYRDNAFSEIMQSLSGIALSYASFRMLDGGEKRITKEYFESELLPLLSPQIIDIRHPFPHLENKAIYIGVRLKSKDGHLFGIIPLPREAERIFVVPGSRRFLLAEDIVLKYADTVFGVYNVEAKALFRVTRNADIEIGEGLYDEDTDYRNFMQEILKKRGKLSPVRLETNSTQDPELLQFFLSRLRLEESQCFVSDSPLDMGFVARLEDRFDPKIKERLLYPPVKPQWPASLAHGDFFAQIRAGDLLLSYPYESFRPFVELLREASEDPHVISIKMTLYRVGRQSQIVQYLCAAAENGKDVTVVVELRARFDEQNNINWSNVMEQSGCKIIYGIDEYKVHSKIMLITRRAGGRLETFTNISTGNYNESTARFYSDLSLITANPEIGEDAVQFFHNLNIANVDGSYRHLLVSPAGLKPGILALIAAERDKALAGKSGRIVMKMNSLTDRDIMEGLVEASQAGVKIDLIVRGICCLRPGLPGYTENIAVRSIVGRFLEHSRIYLFGEGSDARLYIASADMMTRNTERRIEIAAPVQDRKIAGRLTGMLDILLRDNVKARTLHSDGLYSPASNDEERLDSQLYFCSLAYRQAEQGERPAAAHRGFAGLGGLFRRLSKKRDA